MNHDYSLETKLKKEAPDLHRLYCDSVLACQNMLLRYKAFFPNFTDHTVLHSLDVIEFCNGIIGDQVEQLNADEIFVLLMAAYLHDVGMGIDLNSFEAYLHEIPSAAAYRAANPDEDIPNIIRMFHNEFSGCFIRRYAPFFEMPSDAHLFAIVQVSRGHRKTDLYDEAEYPAELPVPNGNVLHLPYLSALIRLADELDIAVYRNIKFLYDASKMTKKNDIIAFGTHEAIRDVIPEEDCFRMIIREPKDPIVREGLDELIVKLGITLAECVDVTAKRTPFTISQTRIVIEKERV